MPAASNLMLSTGAGFYNFGNSKQAGLKRGIPRCYILVPKGTVIPASAFVSQAAFYTYLTASAQGLIADARSNRWFRINKIDTFKDETKKMATVDTGLDQYAGTEYNTKHSFRVPIASQADVIEYKQLDGCEDYSDVIILDTKGQVWYTKDPAGTNGAAALTLAQWKTADFESPDDKDALGVAMFSVQFADRLQLNRNMGLYAAGLSPDNLPGLVNAIITDYTDILGAPLSYVSTTDMIVGVKAADNSYDLVAIYGAVFTAACFVFSNLTGGVVFGTQPLLHGHGAITVGGQAYNYLWFRFGTAPATLQVECAFAANSVITPSIIPNFFTVTERVQLGVNGANNGVLQFA